MFNVFSNISSNRPFLCENKFMYLAIASIFITSVFSCTQTDSIESPQHSQPDFYGNDKATGTHISQQTSAKYVFATAKTCEKFQNFAAPEHYIVDKPLLLKHAAPASFPNANDPALLNGLSPGDMVSISIENGEGFNGNYIINSNGLINIPLLPPIDVLGLPTNVVAERISIEFIKKEIFKAATANVTVQVLHWSEIEVSVSGAVFNPGRVLINETLPQKLEQNILSYGDHSNKRLLSEALRAAAGIRPDAKLDQIILLRKGWRLEADMTGILTGEPVTDYPLITGDRIIVPTTGCFQSNLVRPSQITPKGFRIFMSNLIAPAMSNSNAAVGRYSANVPYGTRLLQSAISANCVGGKQWTNAPRKVVLVSVNPLTKQTQVIERSIEELIRKSNRESINPYLMPNDAVACYDSDVTNLRDIANTIADIIIPFKLL
ncbi:polysaccharide biosynthesis/export family protein [Thalassotalea psychrophila]|uniref:Polysaccharide biosynthesis/export family protein n=1 Tax=Thalassotalea psychrophila TaxID=3065647 RepID=A0ABY9TSE8_9GAMM|nr:polysaccharide biosynthesis/export family protein [Colwelliaceae bacterium SQ149]